MIVVGFSQTFLNQDWRSRRRHRKFRDVRENLQRFRDSHCPHKELEGIKVLLWVDFNVI